MLHLADADGVIGLHRYCLHTFGGVGQLTNGNSRTNDSGGTRSFHAEIAEGSLGQDAAMTAMPLQPSNFIVSDADQHQFDWLEGVALQVSCFDHVLLQRPTVRCLDDDVVHRGTTTNHLSLEFNLEERKKCSIAYGCLILFNWV